MLLEPVSLAICLAYSSEDTLWFNFPQKASMQNIHKNLISAVYDSNMYASQQRKMQFYLLGHIQRKLNIR